MHTAALSVASLDDYLLTTTGRLVRPAENTEILLHQLSRYCYKLHPTPK
jgi:hypothetical protein